jgi:prephenate dehydrogenase
MKTETVSIIGLNRITGSIALALEATDLGLTVLGYDYDRSVVTEAKKMEIIDKGVGKVFNAAAAADILLLNVSLERQEETIRAIQDEVREHTLIIDLSGLKSQGVIWADEYLKLGHYVGASPILAAPRLSDGREGIEASRPDLFKHSVFCIMPSANADPKAVETAVNLGRLLGSQPFFLDPLEFDSFSQGLETTPGLLAMALFRAITQSTGWRDMLRFAGFDFTRATAALTNEDLATLAFYDQASTLRWLDAVLEELRQVRHLLANGDQERMELILEQLSVDRERWLMEREKNDWLEDKTDQVSGLSLTGQMFGFGRPKTDDK